jgi:hypothetical protein
MPALADNVPYYDLRVTKGHSFLLDGVLIPVEFLVNHRSILWDDHAREVTIYHLELATHDVLLANGAPAESYRDDGNRWLFHNANTGWDLAPQEPCAPVLTGGPVVDAVWRRLLGRSGKRPGCPTTEERTCICWPAVSASIRPAAAAIASCSICRQHRLRFAWSPVRACRSNSAWRVTPARSGWPSAASC